MRIKSTGEVDFQSNALGITNVGASGNNWTSTAINIAGTNPNITSEATNGNGAAQITVRVPASGSGGDAGLLLAEGNAGGTAGNQGYYLQYRPGSGYFRFLSTNIDGSATSDDIWRIYDSNTDVRAKDDWVDDYFDYICDGCNKHSDEMFTCCGEVKWHDDVLALREMGKDQTVMQRMVDLGVMHRDEGDDWLGISLQKAQHFTWSGIWQNRERMDAQNEAMDARLKRIEQALGV
jgi:hypothetical protein